ncbi:MAG: outer membrane lipoprotein chaperone LolA [Tatlockia sp.]|jgi:outer membrane lipoprotein carrier protein
MKKALFLLLFLSTPAFCEEVADALQGKLNAMHSLTADFEQVVKTKQREISHASGTMALLRPGRFRWETKEPMEQLVVADGQKIWIYDVDLEQVSVKAQEKDLGGTAALFLSSYDNTVTRDFTVKKSETGEREVFDLTSKSAKANFLRMKLIFTQNTLSGLEMFDQLGQHTIITLTDIKANPTISTNVFEFKPPKGTDVVTQ